MIYLLRKQHPIRRDKAKGTRTCSVCYVCAACCGRTSRGVTQEKAHTGFLIHLPSAVLALIFLARRIQPLFLSLVDREVEFYVLLIRINRSPLLVGHFILFW